MEGLSVEHVLTRLDWYGTPAAKAGGGRGTRDSLYKSRSGLDLVGEMLNLQNIEIAFKLDRLARPDRRRSPNP